MELRKDLELVSVEYENEGKKAVMTFLDRERREIRTVNFNRQSYDNGKYVDDKKKAEKVDQWCADIFEASFDRLASCVGQKKDVYCYDNFNSLFEVEQIEKFTDDMLGEIFQTSVKEILVDENAIRIRYLIEGKTYESKMSYATYMPDTQMWFVDPIKKEKQFKKFGEKFGVPVEQKDELIGHALMVECKKAMGKYCYGDIKKFPKK